MGSGLASGDLAGGAISYTGSCIYGSSANGFVYPSIPDGGPVNRYLAGTFSYSVVSSNSVSSNSTVSSGTANTNIVTITAKDIYGNVAHATATVTLICNQSDSKVQSITVSQESEQTLLENKKNTIKIFPNPTTGQFSVQLSRQKGPQVSVQILNESGKIVTQKTMSLNGTTAIKLDFNLNNQPVGIFMIKVISSEGIQVGKVILLR